MTTTELETMGGMELEALQADEALDARVKALVALANSLPVIEKSMDAINRFIMRRSLPEDWVSFKDPKNQTESVELTGPGSDRIARAVGISFVDWKEPVKETGADEHGPWYVWWYECTVVFQGRRIEKIMGRAGTRDIFFGYENKTWKKAEEVKEDNVKTAARHNAMKEGVKLILGLRRVPRSVIITMGLDDSKIKSVEFGSKGKALDDTAKTVNAQSGLAERVVTLKSVVPATGVTQSGKNAGKPWRRLDVYDTEGVKWMMWSSATSKREAVLNDALAQKVPVKIEFQTHASERGEQYEIVKVNGVVDGGAA